MELKFTKHASDKMMWLGISKEQVRDVISKGSKFKQTDGLLAKYGYVCVAYKKIDEDSYKVKTVYVE